MSTMSMMKVKVKVEKRRVSISMVDRQRSPIMRTWGLTSIVFDPTRDVGR